MCMRNMFQVKENWTQEKVESSFPLMADYGIIPVEHLHPRKQQAMGLGAANGVMNMHKAATPSLQEDIMGMNTQMKKRQSAFLR